LLEKNGNITRALNSVPLPAPYAVILLGYGIWLVEANFTMSTPI